MNIDFKKIWASGVKGLTFPQDAEVTTGLDYLGKLAPSEHLHDVIFQRFDRKDLFLFKQIENACKRYGVNIEATDDDKFASALADAISNGIRNQTRASQINTGIVRLATSSETSSDSVDLAVTPKHMTSWVNTRLDSYTTRDEFLSNWRQLKPVATSGILTDAVGNLPFTRLDNIPEWIRKSSDDGKSVSLRAPDSTAIRLGYSYLDSFNSRNALSFRVNLETGSIETGNIHQSQVHDLGQVARDNNYNSLNNLPSLGEASKRNVFDTYDVNQIPWDGFRLPSTSVCRALKDYIDTVKASISSVGVSNNINDAHGVLGKNNGGTGRADGNYDAQWFFTPAGDTTNRGFVLGSSLNNKITDGSDDEDPNSSGNVTIDTWNSIAFRSSINQYQTTFKHCARTGLTYNRGSIALFGGGEKEIRNNDGALLIKGGSNHIRVGYDNLDVHLKGGSKVFNIDANANLNFTGGGQVLLRNTNGRLGLMAKNGDALYVDDGSLYLQNTKGENKFAIHDGNVDILGSCHTWGSAGFHSGLEIFGTTPYIDLHFNNNTSSDYDSRLIMEVADRLTLKAAHMTFERDVTINGRINGGGLGDGAYASFGGNSSAWSMAGNDKELIRSSQFVDLRTNFENRFNRLNGVLDKSVFDNSSATAIDDLPWGSGQVVATGHLRNVLGRLKWAESRTLYNTDNAWAFAGSEWEIPTTLTLAAVRNWANSWFVGLKSASQKEAVDCGSFDAIDWNNEQVPTMSVAKRIKDELNAVKYNMTNAVNNCVSDVRWVRMVNNQLWGRGASYGNNYCDVVSQIRIEGQVDGNNDTVSISRLQVYKNGRWQTATIDGLRDI